MSKENILAEISRLKEERAKVKEELKSLSREITRLEQKSGKYYKRETLQKVGAGFCEKTFGKRYRDLTPEELREYNKFMQRERRKKPQ